MRSANDRSAGQPASVIETAGLEASTAYLLARTGMESRRRWARMLADRELAPAHYGVLMALGQLGATSQRELSRLVGIDPRNAVPVIDLLEDRGLIQRRPDPVDRRRNAIVLTSAGRAVMNDLGRAGTSLEEDMLGSLSDRERRALHRLLRKLFREVTAVDDNHGGRRSASPRER